jgi:hypothetical protein
MKIRFALLSLSVCLGLLVAPAAFATTNYGTILGTGVDFVDINETSLTGDPEPLFGAPILTGGGNQITFFPTTFIASAAGAAGFDQTGALLNLTLMASGPGSTITEVIIDEFGDFLFAGAGFTAGTNVTVTLSGDLTVLETVGGAIIPVTIPFNATGLFTPEGDGSFQAPDYGNGAFNWNGSVSIDVAGAVADATKAELQLNNFLFAFSEAGTSATIQKKVGDVGVVITVVPEPGTALLLIGGLTALGIRARRLRV